MVFKNIGILDSGVHHHQKLSTPKAEEEKVVDHKSGLDIQTRRDTTDPIPGEPDYVHPDGSSPAIVRI